MPRSPLLREGAMLKMQKLPARTENLSGRKFGRWTVIDYRGMVNRSHTWRCQCECGAFKWVNAGNLRSGKSQSCGCLQKERASKGSKVHGNSNHPFYQI